MTNPPTPSHPITLRCSVILVGYNSQTDLQRGLPSLLASCPGDVEIILVDNASHDGSVEWVKSNFSSIRVVQSASNLGFGGANNLGAQQARGRYLAFLNPDTTVEPDWLSSLLNVLDSNPEVGLVTSKIMLMDNPERINTCGNDIHISGLTLCRGLNTAASNFLYPETVSAISGAAFAMRRELFEQLGGFDETFFMYMEDTDLSLRARLLGWQIVYEPGSRVYHDYSLQFGPRKTFYQERNRYLMLLKVLRGRTLAALAPALFLAEAVTWGFVLLREPLRIPNKLRAYGWILSHMAEILRLRHITQAQRTIPDRALLLSFSTRLDFSQTGESLAARLAGSFFNPLFVLCGKFAHRMAAR